MCKNILYTVIVVAHKDVATRCVLRAINASKCPSSQRSTDPLAGFEGGKGGKGGKGLGREKCEVKGQKGERREEERS